MSASAKGWYKLFLVFTLLIIIVTIRKNLPAGSDTAVQAAPNDATVIKLGGERTWHAAPAAADFNGNGYKEIVVGTYAGMLHVLAYDGNQWSVAWSRQTAKDLNAILPPSYRQSEGRIDSAPAIADLEHDGRLEIVVTTGGAPDGLHPENNRNGGVIVYQYEGEWSFSVKPGWPFAMPDTMGAGPIFNEPDGVRDGIFASAAIGDLDGNSDLEIVTIGFDRRIHAWHHTGNVVSGWPISRENGDPILRAGWSTPALGDIDGDDLPEVVVGTAGPPWVGDGHPDQPPDYTKASVWALNGDSSLVDGFPTVTEQLVQSSPALGDITGDGTLEIVVGTGVGIEGSGGYKVHAWHGDGTKVRGWPQLTAGNVPASPALADLDEDGVLDVIVGCGAESDQSCKHLYAWRGSGRALPGFPMQPVDVNPWPDQHNPQALPYPPVVADIDSDDHPEILLAMSRSAGVSVVEHDGQMNTDFSRVQQGLNTLLASPLVDDVDNDGLLETIIAGDADGEAAVHIWDELGTTDPLLPWWPMFHRNTARSGRFLFPRLSFLNTIHIMHQKDSGTTIVREITLQNKGDGEIDWTLEEVIPTLQASPSSGTITGNVNIEFTINSDNYTVGTWHDLGTVTATGTFKGDPVDGSPQTTRIWLYVADEVTQLYLPAITR